MSGDKEHDEEDEFEVPEIHRDEDLDEEGVSQVAITQFVHYRLPFLLQVKQEMDDGKVLTDGELELMTRIVSRAHHANRFAYQHPELKELIARVIDLVHDIAGEALANAQEAPRDKT